jgi:hypothetical protein
MTTLDRTCTAILQKSPDKGGWTYVVNAGLRRVLRHPGPGPHPRPNRRLEGPAVPQVLHDPRRRHPQARRPANVRAQIGQQAGHRVTVHLDERLSPTPRRSIR